MVMRILTNWADDGLTRVLRKYGIYMVFIKENMPLNVDFKYVDLIYYASPCSTSHKQRCNCNIKKL